MEDNVLPMFFTASRGKVLLACILAHALGCKAIAKGAAEYETRRKAGDILVAACQNTGVANAAEYKKGRGLHPIYSLRPNTRSYGGSYEPNMEDFGTKVNLRAKGISDAQLVMCAEKTVETVVGECAFNRVDKVGFVKVPGSEREGPTFPQISVSQRVRLMVARTGELVAEKTFVEPAPRCDKPLLGKPSANTFRSSLPASSTIEAWATAYAVGDK
jgi:hypothetical protein